MGNSTSQSTSKTDMNLLTQVQRDGNLPPDPITSMVDRQSVDQLNTCYKSSSDPSSMVTPKSTRSLGPIAVHSSSSFPLSMNMNLNAYVYRSPPPPASELIGSLDQFNIPDKIYREAYYSNENDVPDKLREYAGLLYQLNGGEGVNALDEWDDGQPHVATRNANLTSKEYDMVPGLLKGVGGWEYASYPPSCREAKKWLSTDTGQRLIKKTTAPSQVMPLDAASHDMISHWHVRSMGPRKPIHSV
jgi:DNA polymerase zeta